MAETVDREASRQRFLAMASDFEARAATAEESTDPDPHAAVNLRPGKKLATESKEAV
jgi:hypothetical protein